MEALNRAEAAGNVLLAAETYPLLHNVANTEVLLRLWRFPALESWKSWTVLMTRDSLKVRRLVWQPGGGSGDDLLMVGAESLMTAKLWKPQREALVNLRLDPFEHVSNDGIGLDGVTYGIEASTRFGSTRLSWWQEPPITWAELARWHSSTIDQFESLLPRHVAPHRP